MGNEDGQCPCSVRGGSRLGSGLSGDDLMGHCQGREQSAEIPLCTLSLTATPLLFPQDVIEDYQQRSKRRSPVFKELDAKCLRWTPFVPPSAAPPSGSGSGPGHGGHGSA